MRGFGPIVLDLRSALHLWLGVVVLHRHSGASSIVRAAFGSLWHLCLVGLCGGRGPGHVKASSVQYLCVLCISCIVECRDCSV
jgi:hypothetical protein